MALPDLSVALTASTEGFETALNRAIRSSATASQQIGEHVEKLNRGFERTKQVAEAALAIFAVEKFAGLIEGTIAAADKLDRLAQSTGIAVETLSGLAFAAHLADVDLDSAAAGFVKLDKSIAAAAAGNKDAIATYTALGISVRDANGNVKSADQVLVEAADKFAGYEDGANKTALAIALFGKRGAELIPLLNMGGAAIQANTEYAKKYGGVTEEITRQAAEFEDTQKRINLLGTAFATTLTAQLLPAMQAVAGEFLSMKEDGDQFKSIAGDIAEILKEIGIGATFAVQGLLFLRTATKELGEIASAAAHGTLGADYSGIIAENEGKFEKQKAALEKLRDAINAPPKNNQGIDFGFGNSFDTKKQAPSVLKDQAKAAVDPLVEYLNNLQKEGLKFKFDTDNFDRFKGAAGTSKEALVAFDVEFGKFSDSARIAANLPILTPKQKTDVLAAGKAVADYAEQLERVKALHAFDDSVKQIGVQASLVGKTNEQREITLALLDLEKKGIKAGTDEYEKRVLTITEAVHQLALAQQLQGVKAFTFAGDQSHSDAAFQLSLIGKTRDEVQDLTAARQIDLNVQRQAFDETGKQQVSDQTLTALKEEAARQKAQLAVDNTATRTAQRSALTGAQDFFNDYVAAANDAASQVKGALTEAFSAAEDAFVQFITTGKLDFKSFANSVSADLARIAFKNIASSGIQSLQGLVGSDSGLGKILAGVGGAAGSDGASGALSSAGSTAALATFSTAVTAANAPMLALTTAATSAAAALDVLAASSGGDSAAGAGGIFASLLGDVAASAKGNVFAGGNVVPFAKGGIVNSPHIFPMKNGGTGLMGEAGPEAIVPLKRGRDGSLGIANHGGSQSSGPNVTNITNINVAADQSRDLRTANQKGRAIRRQLG